MRTTIVISIVGIVVGSIIWYIPLMGIIPVRIIDQSIVDFRYNKQSGVVSSQSELQLLKAYSEKLTKYSDTDFSKYCIVYSPNKVKYIRYYCASGMLLVSVENSSEQLSNCIYVVRVKNKPYQWIKFTV
jgi:hypothetical protein